MSERSPEYIDARFEEYASELLLNYQRIRDNTIGIAALSGSKAELSDRQEILSINNRAMFKRFVGTFPAPVPAEEKLQFSGSDPRDIRSIQSSTAWIQTPVFRPFYIIGDDRERTYRRSLILAAHPDEPWIDEVSPSFTDFNRHISPGTIFRLSPRSSSVREDLKKFVPFSKPLDNKHRDAVYSSESETYRIHALSPGSVVFSTSEEIGLKYYYNSIRALSDSMISDCNMIGTIGELALRFGVEKEVSGVMDEYLERARSQG